MQYGFFLHKDRQLPPLTPSASPTATDPVKYPAPGEIRGSRFSAAVANQSL